jgi:hypothetical protein
MSQVTAGAMPPLAGGYVARPEIDEALSDLLVPGTTEVLVPAVPAPGGRDWGGVCGRTQIAVRYARAARAASDASLLAWVSATSRSSVLSTYAEAAVALGLRAAGDADAAAARLLLWLRETSRPWLIVLDDVAAPAVMDGRAGLGLFRGGPDATGTAAP